MKQQIELKRCYGRFGGWYAIVTYTSADGGFPFSSSDWFFTRRGALRWAHREAKKNAYYSTRETEVIEVEV